MECGTVACPIDLTCSEYEGFESDSNSDLSSPTFKYVSDNSAMEFIDLADDSQPSSTQSSATTKSRPSTFSSTDIIICGHNGIEPDDIKFLTPGCATPASKRFKVSLTASTVPDFEHTPPDVNLALTSQYRDSPAACTSNSNFNSSRMYLRECLWGNENREATACHTVACKQTQRKLSFEVDPPPTSHESVHFLLKNCPRSPKDVRCRCLPSCIDSALADTSLSHQHACAAPMSLESAPNTVGSDPISLNENSVCPDYDSSSSAPCPLALPTSSLDCSESTCGASEAVCERPTPPLNMLSNDVSSPPIWQKEMSFPDPKDVDSPPRILEGVSSGVSPISQYDSFGCKDVCSPPVCLKDGSSDCTSSVSKGAYSPPSSSEFNCVGSEHSDREGCDSDCLRTRRHLIYAFRVPCDVSCIGFKTPLWLVKVGRALEDSHCLTLLQRLGKHRRGIKTLFDVDLDVPHVDGSGCECMVAPSVLADPTHNYNYTPTIIGKFGVPLPDTWQCLAERLYSNEHAYNDLLFVLPTGECGGDVEHLVRSSLGWHVRSESLKKLIELHRSKTRVSFTPAEYIFSPVSLATEIRNCFRNNGISSTTCLLKRLQSELAITLSWHESGCHVARQHVFHHFLPDTLPHVVLIRHALEECEAEEPEGTRGNYDSYSDPAIDTDFYRTSAHQSCRLQLSQSTDSSSFPSSQASLSRSSSTDASVISCRLHFNEPFDHKFHHAVASSSFDNSMKLSDISMKSALRHSNARCSITPHKIKSQSPSLDARSSLSTSKLHLDRPAEAAMGSQESMVLRSHVAANNRVDNEDDFSLLYAFRLPAEARAKDVSINARAKTRQRYLSIVKVGIVKNGKNFQNLLQRFGNHANAIQCRFGCKPDIPAVSCKSQQTCRLDDKHVQTFDSCHELHTFINRHARAFRDLMFVLPVAAKDKDLEQQVRCLLGATIQGSALKAFTRSLAPESSTHRSLCASEWVICETQVFEYVREAYYSGALRDGIDVAMAFAKEERISLRWRDSRNCCREHTFPQYIPHVFHSQIESLR
eukprot:Rmarinus@m.16457